VSPATINTWFAPKASRIASRRAEIGRSPRSLATLDF